MKGSIITFALVILIIMSGYWVWKEYTSMPPEPIIMISEERVEVVRGTYCWSSELKGVCEDTFATPPELIAYYGTEPADASPESILTIEFDRDPIEDSFSLTRWIDDENEVDVMVKGNEFVLPKEKGTYIYGVSANWDEGDAVYAFVIDVK